MRAGRATGGRIDGTRRRGDAARADSVRAASGTFLAGGAAKDVAPSNQNRLRVPTPKVERPAAAASLIGAWSRHRSRTSANAAAGAIGPLIGQPGSGLNPAVPAGRRGVFLAQPPGPRPAVVPAYAAFGKRRCGQYDTVTRRAPLLSVSTSSLMPRYSLPLERTRKGPGWSPIKNMSFSPTRPSSAAAGRSGSGRPAL